MGSDARALAEFYQTPMGQMARRAILRPLRAFWPDMRGRRLLGYGFAIPYLSAFAGDAERAKVVIVRGGLRREIEFQRDQPSILDCASAAGLEVPYSCTSGVCGTCRAKVIEGDVRMERNFALDKAEVAAGFVLPCQAHPTTERVVLSFDER